jgi:hypothetical protein
MGLSKSYLLPLPKSFQTAASSHSRRVLPGLWLQPQIRHPAAQWSSATKPKTNLKGRRPTYGLKVILSLTAIWEAAGYPCSARLKALLPLWLPWAQKRFAISAQAQKQLLSISPATIDRRLKPKKRQLKNRLYGRTKPGTLLKVGPLEVGAAPFRTAHIYVYQPCLRELRSEEIQSTAKPFWLEN